MANRFVHTWHPQLFRHCNHSWLDMATAIDLTWQLQLSRHVNCVLSSHHVNTNVTYVPSPDSLSTKSLHTTHLCTTLMAGTWLPLVAMCCMKVLRFSIKLVSLCHPCMFNFMATPVCFFLYTLPWFATLATWSWSPVHLSTLAPYAWPCHGTPVCVVGS